MLLKDNQQLLTLIELQGRDVLLAQNPVAFFLLFLIQARTFCIPQ